jgi:glycine betaine catabolism B
VAFKEARDAITDIAKAGMVITRKVAAGILADERRLDHDAVERVVSSLHPGRVLARVASVHDETESATTIRLVPEGADLFPPFVAGQYIAVYLDVDGVPTSRPYSISSPPTNTGYLEITVRELPDGFVSKYLCHSARAGDLFEVSAPAGRFVHDPLVDTDELVFIAGGSGVTPFASMIREVVDLKSGPSMRLIYGTRTELDVIFGDELMGVACCEDGVDLKLVVSEPGPDWTGTCGLLDRDIVTEFVGPIEGKTFFICGPPAMHVLCEGALLELGVPAKRIKTEASGPPPDVTLVEGWPEGYTGEEEYTVKIAGGASFRALSAEPLLNSLERNGATIENLCRSGECGVCRAGLVSGSVFMPDTTAIRKSDAAFGYIHPCVSYPLSDIEIRI